jgi:hypothetical protein
VGETLVVEAGHTFLATHDGENDRVLEGRAKHRLNGAVRVAYPKWGIEVGGRIAVELGRVYFVPDAQDVERKTDARALTQLDVRLSKHFTQHLEIAAGVDNLLDAGDRFALLRPRTVYGSIGGRY